MKPHNEKNFYELLEIPPEATQEQISQAFDLARKTYGDRSLASYSLFDSRERQEIMRRIFLAYETLSDEKRRWLYDRDLGIKRKREAPLRPAARENGPRQIPLEEAPRGVAFREKPRTETLNGALLKEYRESLSVPLQEIANRTRINITYFEFMEKERYESLPPPVYLRGYIKQYAKLLGLEPEPVAERIISLVEKAQAKGVEHSSQRRFN